MLRTFLSSQWDCPICTISKMGRHISVHCVAFLLFLVSAAALEKCYEDIGCFDNGPPFYDPLDRPISWLPESREDVGTSFRLNTRGNPDPDTWQELSTYDSTTLTNSLFSPTRETKFVVHGYIQGSTVEWMEDMTTELLTKGDYNVIRVDWRKGALDLYGIATANTRIVGAEISLLIDQLKTYFGVSGSSMHIIGHSLGAHVAGYAGERQLNPQVARLTGLDPAGPYFEDMDPVVRLDPTDGAMVDVIHTDTDPLYTMGLGMYAPCGHMDFFPNGGREQPGCDSSLTEFIEVEGSIWGGMNYFVACNHLRSIDYFSESINSDCQFLAFQCTRDHDDYNYGFCFDSSLTADMGWNAPDSYPGGEGIIYQVNTNTWPPHCGYQYKFTFKFDGEDRKAETAKGQIFVTLQSTSTETDRFPLTTETQEYDPDNVYTHVAIANIDPGTLTGLELDWEYDTHWYEFWNWFDTPALFIHQVTVVDVNDNEDTMCGHYDAIEPLVVTQFTRTETVCPSQ